MTRLEVEVRRLREENERLRLERQRPLSTAQAVECAREIRADLDAQASEADGDWATLLELVTLRESLLDLCQEMRTSVAAAERRLRLLVPAPEMDRRVGDRRNGASPEAERLTATEAAT